MIIPIENDTVVDMSCFTEYQIEEFKNMKRHKGLKCCAFVEDNLSGHASNWLIGGINYYLLKLCFNRRRHLRLRYLPYTLCTVGMDSSFISRYYVYEEAKEDYDKILFWGVMNDDVFCEFDFKCWMRQ
jgi:hypothetical protein